MKTKRVNHWCNAFVQPTTFLGVLGIIIIFSGAFFLKRRNSTAPMKTEYGAEPISLGSSKNMRRIFSIVPIVGFCCSASYTNAAPKISILHIG